MKQFSEDVPGNSMASAAALNRMLVNLAEVIVRADSSLDKLWEHDTRVTDIRLRLPQGEGGGVMVVVKAYVQGEAVVAFNGGDTFWEAIRSTLLRLERGSMKWKEDQYA